MSAFTFFRKETESVLLIDIGSASIAGAYVRIEEIKKPAIYYTARIPIRIRKKHDANSNMEIALSELLEILTHKGASVFAHATGSATVERVVVSVSSPWQETHTHIERIVRDKPFQFTQKLLNSIVEKSSVTDLGRTLVAKMVIATKLNGYNVVQPFGKIAKDAEAFIMSSSIATDIVKTIRTTIRSSMHAPNIEVTAFAPIMFLILRDLYSDKKSFLVMDVSGETTDFLLIKDSILLEDMSVPYGLNELRRVAIESGVDSTATDEPLRAINDTNLFEETNKSSYAKRMRTLRDVWMKNLTDSFISLRTRNALPKELLLLADKSAYGFIKDILLTPEIHPLGISDDSLQISYIDPGQLAPYVTHHAKSEGDIFLSLLALYSAKNTKMFVVH